LYGGTSGSLTTAGGQDAGNYFNNFNNTAGLYLKKASTGSGDYIAVEDSSGATQFTIKSSGNVGLGTTSPWAKFSINNTTNDTAGQPLFVVASSTVSATTTLFVVNNVGNVGIASTSPWARASVDTTSLAAGVPSFVVGSSTRTDLLVTQSGAVLLNGTSTYGRLGELFEINTSANFGGQAFNTWNATAGQAGIVDFNRSKSATIGTQSAVTTGDALGYLQFRGSDGTSFVNSALIAGSADAAVSAGIVPGRLTFQTANTSGTQIERMRIDSSGNVGIASTSPWARSSVDTTSLAAGVPSFVVGSSTRTDFVVTQAGNVGIGTTSPEWALDVQGTGAVAARLIGGTSASNNTQLRFYGKNAGAELWAIGTDIAAGNASKDFHVYDLVSLAPRVTFQQSTGNVGIGTTTPANLLTINSSGSNAAFATYSQVSTNAASDVFIAHSIGGAFQSSVAKIQVQRSTSLGQGWNFLVADNAGTISEAMRIAHNGNVGISTTSPNNTLDLYSTSKAALGFSGASGSTYKWTIGMDVSSGGRFAISSSTALGTTDRFVIDGNGNVGIGTTSPAYQLSVGNGGIEINRDSSLEPFVLMRSNGTAVGQLRGINGGGIHLTNGSAATSWLDITGAGNVGIGTTTPANTLNVFGGITTNSGAGPTAAAGPSLTMFYDTSGDRGTIYSLNQGTAWKDLMFEANSFSFISGASTQGLYQGSSGNVGIGTTTPWGVLSVEMNTTNPAFVVSNQGSSTPSFYIGGVNQNGFVGVGTSSIQATSTLRFVVQNGTSIASSPVAAFYNTSGNCSIVPTAGITCSSDIRLKKNINTFVSSSLEKIKLLSAVTYNWNSEATGTPTHAGFIAQAVEELLPDLVYTDDYGMKSLNYAGFTPYITDALQEVALDLQAIASTTASSTPVSQVFAASFFSNIFARVTTWLADAGNGIADLFAETIHAKTIYADKLCLGATCVTEEQLKALLSGETAHAAGPATSQSAENTGSANSESQNSATASSSTSDQTQVASSSADTEAPTISLNGNNPATVNVGASYIDLGAVVTDNIDQNTSYKVSLDGAPAVDLSQISVDTSVVGEYQLVFTATDLGGNTGMATRVVNVVSLIPPPVDVAATPTATSTLSTSSQTSPEATLGTAPQATP
jgi:hypothetical protein